MYYKESMNFNRGHGDMLYAFITTTPTDNTENKGNHINAIFFVKEKRKIVCHRKSSFRLAIMIPIMIPLY
jgi:hypothetical protein